jgi:cyclophilin family peptidyl-prolyl cis-trans isomerase
VKSSPMDRRVRSAALFSIEPLESRCLLAATLLSQIPDQSTNPAAPTTVNLSTFFDDSSIPAGDTVVDIQTNLPAPDNNIALDLTTTATPGTVANFLDYINNGEFANTIFHRSVPGFILQGGGYTTNGNLITSLGTITGESSTATLTNTTGTIAMALSSGPDSATSEWFINLVNNDGSGSTPNLDDTSDGGPFTAFGKVLYNGMDAVNAIAALPTVNDVSNGAWSNLPVQNYTGASGAAVSSVPNDSFVTTNPIVVPGGVMFSAQSANTNLVTTSISNGVLTLNAVPGATGSTTVTVTATDFGGGTASSTFTVNLTGLALTSPATATVVNQGDSFAVNWTGGNSSDTVQVWAEGGPNQAWTELTTGVPETNGSFSWNTTGVDHGWYHFLAWDIPTSGTPYAVNSPDFVHIVSTTAAAPNISLTNPPLSTDSVAEGNSYTLNFVASAGGSDTNPVFVQLWVYSGNTGQWSVLPNANSLPAGQGSYSWDTTGVAPGFYSFAAHATNGDQWSYANSPGFLQVTITAPTISVTTPTAGQPVIAGQNFNLNYSVTGLSASDMASATMQIWAQRLVNGSPIWTEISSTASPSAGTFVWSVPTSPGAGTFYAFLIWVNVGNQWYSQGSANWLQVT